MSIIAQINPFDFFTDTSGDALDEGYVWVGIANKDPRQFPVTAYYDAALTIPAAMPLRTNSGYIVRNNAPAFVYLDGNYSVLVQNKSNVQIYYIPDVLLIGNQQAVSKAELGAPNGSTLVGGGLVTVADMTVLLSQAQGTNQAFSMIGYNPGTTWGGGEFRWSATTPRTKHDGGAIVSPTVPWNGAVGALAAFLAGAGDTAPGSLGCFVRTSGRYRVTMWGALPVATVSNAVIANDAAINAAIKSCSSYSVGGNITELQVDDDCTFLCAGTFSGTNKSVFQPKSNVRITGSGTLKVQDGANTLAGATGWNLIYPSENTDPAVNNFEVVGVNFDGNGLNNLNLSMKRNAAIGVLTGTGIRVNKCQFLNFPGFHVLTMGRDIFPQTVSSVFLTYNQVNNVAEGIVGNTGIVDHSSFYMLATDAHADNNRFITAVASQVATCIEIHGNDSTANLNYYNLYLNLVNVAGLITNASNIRIANNIGEAVQMLVRGYSQTTFSFDNLVIADNQATIATTSLCQIDLGGAQVSNLLIGSVTIQDNYFSFIGVDTISPPPCIWIRGVLKTTIKGNTIRNNFAYSVLISNAAANAVIYINENVFDNPNRTATVSFASAVYIDAITNPFKLLDVSRNVFRACRQYAVQCSFNAVGSVVKFMDNTVTETSDLIGIPTGCFIGRVDVMHYGDVPAGGQFSTNYGKISMGSTIVDSANNQTWKIKTLPSNGLFNSEVYGTAAPISGSHFQGDIVNINAPASGSFIGAVCVTSGTPGTWKSFGAIA